MEGVLIELLTLANILSVDFIKMHSIHKSCELRKELRHGFMKTLKRGKYVSVLVMMFVDDCSRLHCLFINRLNQFYLTFSSVGRALLILFL